MQNHPLNMKHKIIRLVCLIILAVLTFLLGLIRYQYVINLVDSSLPMLLPRDDAETNTYPLSILELWTSLKTDPRWLSNLIYFSYPAFTTVLAVYLIFHKKKYSQLTLLFYMVGLLVLVLLVSVSLLLQKYEMGYGLAQYIKKVYQEPYISLLLLSGFYWNEEQLKKVG